MAAAARFDTSVVFGRGPVGNGHGNRSHNIVSTVSRVSNLGDGAGPTSGPDWNGDLIGQTMLTQIAREESSDRGQHSRRPEDNLDPDIRRKVCARRSRPASARAWRRSRKPLLTGKVTCIAEHHAAIGSPPGGDPIALRLAFKDLACSAFLRQHRQHCSQQTLRPPSQSGSAPMWLTI